MTDLQYEIAPLCFTIKIHLDHIVRKTFLLFLAHGMEDSLLKYLQWMLPMLGLRGDLRGPLRAGEPPRLGGAPAAEGAAQGGRHLPGDRRPEAGGGQPALRADAESRPPVRGDRP